MHTNLYIPTIVIKYEIKFKCFFIYVGIGKKNKRIYIFNSPNRIEILCRIAIRKDIVTHSYLNIQSRMYININILVVNSNSVLIIAKQ